MAYLACTTSYITFRIVFITEYVDKYEEFY